MEEDEEDLFKNPSKNRARQVSNEKIKKDQVKIQ